MNTTTRPTKQTGLAKRLVNKTTELHAAQQDIKKLEKDLKEAHDIIGVLTNENLELGKVVKDYQARFDKGCMWYTEDNQGYMLDVGYILPYSKVSYIQDVPSEVNTALYKKNENLRFVKVTNRTVNIDEERYKKYKGVLI